MAGLYVECLRAFWGTVTLHKSLFSAHGLIWIIAPYGLATAVSATMLLWLKPWTRKLGLVCLGLVGAVHLVLAAVHRTNGPIVEAVVYVGLCLAAGRYLLSKDYAEMEKTPEGHHTRNLRALHLSLTAFGLFCLAGLLAIALEPVVPIPLGSP